MTTKVTEPYACECVSGAYIVLHATDFLHAEKRLREEYKEEPVKIKRVR